MKTIKEKSIEWRLSTRRINALIQDGKIPTAIKTKQGWLIPDDVNKPVDGRRKNINSNDNSNKLFLPMGEDKYINIQKNNYYYVDKTLLIKEIIDKNSKVTLFTRPRRFGKSLNMDMLKSFFEISSINNSIYFKDKKIWKCGSKYLAYQGKYPIIYLTFKDVKYATWEETINNIKYLIRQVFSKNRDIIKSNDIDLLDKEYFNDLLNNKDVDLSLSLGILSKMLNAYYNIAPIIMIDEYDTPIQEGYSKGFYDQIISFCCNFFSNAFKGNECLTYGFLTGVQRIAQENIFSGLNNLYVNTVFDDEYSEYFGFTSDETIDMLNYYDYKNKIDELKKWYNGYLFGNKEIYNPWSVVYYLAKNATPQVYWANMGENQMIKELMEHSSFRVFDNLTKLLLGEKIISRINHNVVYRLLTSNPEYIYSILVTTGYLKVNKKELQNDGSYICELSIPNLEIASVYKNEILSYYSEKEIISSSISDMIINSLYHVDIKGLEEGIEKYLVNSISFYDASCEGFYHGLVLGLLSLMDNNYKIKSNRESGNGRYDIALEPYCNLNNQQLPGIIIELKWGKSLNEKELESLSQEGYNQINELHYDQEFINNKITDIIKIGIAFSGKMVKIKSNYTR